MKKGLYTLAGLLVGTFTGFGFLFFLVHLSSLFMQSDDDMNRGVRAGLIVWPFIIAISGWLGKAIHDRRCKTKDSRLMDLGLIVMGALAGAVLSDWVLALSLNIADVRDAMDNGHAERNLTLTCCLIVAILGGVLAHRFSKKI